SSARATSKSQAVSHSSFLVPARWPVTARSGDMGTPFVGLSGANSALPERRHHFFCKELQAGQHFGLRSDLAGIDHEQQCVEAGGFPTTDHVNDLLRIADAEAVGQLLARR